MAGNSADTSLRQVFMGMMGGGDIELMQGKVIQADPLRIQMTNDDKLIITDRITIVPRHLTDYTVEATFAAGSGISASTGVGGAHGGHTEGTGTHSHELVSLSAGGSLTLHNALKKGDTVHVLSLNNGKLYYVMDKVV